MIKMSDVFIAAVILSMEIIGVGIALVHYIDNLFKILVMDVLGDDRERTHEKSSVS